MQRRTPPTAPERRVETDQRHQREQRQQDVIAANDPTDGLDRQRMDGEQQRAHERRGPGGAEPERQAEQQQDDRRVQRDVRKVIDRRVAAADLGVQHEGQHDERPVVGPEVAQLAVDLEVAAREDPRRIGEIGQKGLVTSDEVDVVRPHVVEADGAAEQQQRHESQRHREPEERRGSRLRRWRRAQNPSLARHALVT